jgi:hypothetical protein
MPRGIPNPTRIHNGVREKLCTGPSHDVPMFLSVQNFYKHHKQYKPWCKDCDRLYRSMKMGVELNPWIPYRMIEFAILELVRRLGKYETARRIGVTGEQVWNYLHGRTRYVKKRTATKIIVELHKAREINEVRHKDSIHHGSSQRGRVVRVPKKYKDYYISHGDKDNDYKRKERST